MVEPEVVPLIAPAPNQLRAGAVWITIANWADGLADRFGAARIISPDRDRTPAEVRKLAWEGSRATHRKGTPMRRLAPQAVKTALKDARAGIAARRFSSSISASFAASPTPPLVWQHHDLFQTAGLVLGRMVTAPVVLFVDALQVWESERWGIRRPVWGRWLERRAELPALRGASLVCCISQEVADSVVARGIAPDRVVVTPCTADSNRFHPDIDSTDLRTQLGLTSRLVVGWVGSFRPFHALDLLLDGFYLASRADPRLHLLMVGDGPERTRIEARARALGLSATFVGVVDHSRVPKYVATMDLGVIPAAEGPFHYSPLKLKEFHLGGRAVIAPRLGEMDRNLRHLEEAWLYTAGSANELGQAISTLADDEGLRTKLAVEGRTRGLKSHTIGLQIDHILGRLGALGETGAR